MVITIFKYLWASPLTFFGLLLLVGAAATGSTCGTRRRRVIVVYGGWLERIMYRGVPWVGSVCAMTIGHVVIGRNLSALEESLDHEFVHVSQSERFGVFFPAVYLLVSVVAYLNGRDPYWDNIFEQQARGGKPAIAEKTQAC